MPRIATLISIIAPLCALLLAAPAAQAAAPTAGISWFDGDFDAALARARAQRKHLFVDVYAVWCGPCKKLDEQVFNREDIARTLRSLIAVKVDAEKDAGPGVVERYHVVGYPTVLILDPEGQEVDRIFGDGLSDVLEPAAFHERLRGILGGDDTLPALEAKLEKTPDDLALRYRIGFGRAVRGEAEEAERHLNAVVAKDPKNEAGLGAKALFGMGRYLYLRGQKDYVRAVLKLTELIARYPESDEAQKSAPYGLASAWLKLGQPPQALATLRAWLARPAKDAKAEAGRANAFAWFCFSHDIALEEAATVARAGLQKDPGAAHIWDTLAEVLHKQGKRSEAIEAGRKALELKPGDSYYKDQLGKYEKGQVKGS